MDDLTAQDLWRALVSRKEQLDSELLQAASRSDPGDVRYLVDELHKSHTTLDHVRHVLTEARIARHKNA